MDYKDRSTALHAALSALFNRYEALADPEEMARAKWLIGDMTRREAAEKWRASALRYAAGGEASNAFVMAKGAGVPQEELDTLKALLYG